MVDATRVAEARVPVPGSGSPAAPRRDPFVDFVRAFSLLVVVAWHWVFTIIVWRPDGPHATNPIGFTRGLFIATWLLQVMPLFFFVGGYAHTQAWLAHRAGGATIGAFARSRFRQLAAPAAILVVFWIAAGALIVRLMRANGVPRAVTLVLSPLWFLAVYLLLIALFPITYRLHERFGMLVLVWMGGIGLLVDVARFGHQVRWAGWINMVVIWGLCHQLGYFYRELVDAGRRAAWMLAWAGLFTLAGLVGSRIYPGSMVGVPGERFSNMAPPTFTIVALVVFQAGAALLVRDFVLHRLDVSRRWARVNGVVNRFALPLYLFHATGMALWKALQHFTFKLREVRQPDLRWWLGRPFAFVGPLLLTLPVILVFGRRWVKERA